MHSKTINRMTATTLAAVALAGTIGVPAVSARMPADRVPAGGWPDMHASTAQALADARNGKDLRSPDTLDAAAGRGTFNAPHVAVVTLPDSPAQPAASSGGLDWTDAGIGAGGALTILLLAAGGAFAVGHRRRGGVPTV